MNGFSGWLRQFLGRLTVRLRNFMEGRYGMDKLNMVILWAGVISSLLSAIIPVPPVNLIFWGLSYVLMILSIFRILSASFLAFRIYPSYLISISTCLAISGS